MTLCASHVLIHSGLTTLRGRRCDHCSPFAHKQTVTEATQLICGCSLNPDCTVLEPSVQPVWEPAVSGREVILLSGMAFFTGLIRIQIVSLKKTSFIYKIHINPTNMRLSPKRVEKLHLHKNFHEDVYSSFIYNCQKVEATKCPSVGECINCITCRQWNIIQH